MVIFCRKNWIFVDAGLLKHNRTSFIGSFWSQPGIYSFEPLDWSLWIGAFINSHSIRVIRSEHFDWILCIGAFGLDPLKWSLWIGAFWLKSLVWSLLIGTVGSKSLNRSLCIGVFGPKSFRMSVSVVAVQSGPLNSTLWIITLLVKSFYCSLSSGFLNIQSPVPLGLDFPFIFIIQD